MDSLTRALNNPLIASLPTKRAAYADRTAVLMAVMSKLAYIPFEQPREEKLDRVIEAIQRAKSLKAARETLNEFYRDYRTNYQTEVREELETHLGMLGFTLSGTYVVGDTQAFLATKPAPNGEREADTGVAVLSFRGTEQKIQDWKTNLNARRTRMTGVPVHGGFWKAFDGVRPKIQKDLTPLIDAGYTLYVTGHSLGGALALIATREIGHDSTGACYTFGQPRVSGYGFAEKIKTPIYRVVNATDIVPRVPPAIIPHLLRTALSLAPFPGRDLLKRLIEEFSGYVHHGDMRYMPRAKESDDGYRDVRLLANPNVFDRTIWWVSDVVLRLNLGGPTSDHSMDRYIDKLLAYADKRNPDKTTGTSDPG